MLYARIEGIGDIEVTSVNISLEQNSVGSFEYVVPLKNVADYSLYLRDTAIIYGGVVIISGLINGEPELEISENRILLARISAWDELGRLHCSYGALSDAHFQNTAVSSALVTLLNLNTSDWQLGDISTMANPLIATTADVRPKEGRWAQVIDVVSSIPSCMARYGGFNSGAGRFEVNIGAFGNLFDEAVLQGVNLISIQKNKPTNEQLRQIEAFGGRSGDTIVTLQNALNYDPSLAFHPEYPIITSFPYYYVERVGAVGCARRRDYDLHRTENSEPPTDAELNEAGYALWQHCVRDFEKNAPYESYSVNCRLSKLPAIGDKIYVRGEAYETIYDHTTQRSDYRRTWNIDNTFYITRVEAEITQLGLICTLEISDSLFSDSVDDAIEVYDTTKNTDKFSAVRAATGVVIITQSLNQGGVIDNCIYTGPPVLPGRTFTIPLPTPPAGATDVYYTYSISPGYAVDDSTLTVPQLPATPFSGCVTNLSGGWTPASAAVLTVQFTFILG